MQGSAHTRQKREEISGYSGRNLLWGRYPCKLRNSIQYLTPLIVPAQDDRKYSVRMLDNLQMESHSPDFIIPMDERTPQQTHAHIFDQLLPYLHPLPGHDHCGLCHLWTRNVHSCHFLEPLFTSDRCSEHVHFNIRDRLIKKSN